MAWKSQTKISTGPMRGVAKRVGQALARASGRVFPAVGHFAREQSGAVAIIFGVVVVAAGAAIGLALDYDRWQWGQKQLQEAVDSAGLALPRLPIGANIQDEALKWVKMSLTTKGVSPSVVNSVTVTVGRVGDTYSLVGRMRMGMSLFAVEALTGAITGSEQVGVAAAAGIDATFGKLEVAMVLDITGSMKDPIPGSSNRITALRPAAQEFITILQNAARSTGQVKISLVPFSQTVRINAGLRTNSWIDKGTNPAGHALFNGTPTDRIDLFYNKLFRPWKGCLEERPYPHNVRDTAASVGTPETLFIPYFAPDEPDQPSESKSGGWTESVYPNDYLYDTWSYTSPGPGVYSGSPADWKVAQGNASKYRSSNWDAKGSSSPGGSVPKQVRVGNGPNQGCSGDILDDSGNPNDHYMPVIEPLTDVKDLTKIQALRDSIAEMMPTGQTNLVIGLGWGWQTLSPNGPILAGRSNVSRSLDVGKPYTTPELSKVAVFLTDGLNNFKEFNKSNSNDLTCSTDPDDIKNGRENKNRAEYQGLTYPWMNRLGLFGSTPGTPLSSPYGCEGEEDDEVRHDRRDQMNARFRELCNNMKAPIDPANPLSPPKVTIYTIGVRVFTSGKQVLQDCAGPGRFYDVQNTQELLEAFRLIANEVRQTKLTY